MYDMPDDEIIGFWGKRPFIGKRILLPTERKGREPLKLPVLPPISKSFLETPQPPIEVVPSWHDDPTLFGR
jgi:hypothetical protein